MQPAAKAATSASRFAASDVPFLCVVGAAAASFWRGSWYTMDALVFPDDVRRSCAASLTLGFGGFALAHEAIPRLAPATPAARGLTLYAAALSCVAAWRGVWLSWDLATGSGAASPPPATPPTAAEAEAERRRTLASGLASHACATALLVGVGHLTAALAPPARIGVLADRTSWAFGKPSKYLEDVGMFVNNFARRKGP